MNITPYNNSFTIPFTSNSTYQTTNKNSFMNTANTISQPTNKNSFMNNTFSQPNTISQPVNKNSFMNNTFSQPNTITQPVNKNSFMNNTFSQPNTIAQPSNKNSFMNNTFTQPNTITQPVNKNSFMNNTFSHPNTITQPNTVNLQPVNPEKIVDNFIYEYYKKVSESGWNTTTHLFSHNCEVLYKNKIIGNEHDLVNILSTELIKKAIYSELNINWIVLSDDILMINIFGRLQFISYINEYGYPFVFTETFILKHAENNNIMCYYHIFNF